MTSKVFISYSRRDRAVVTKIADELDQLGQEVWLDEELSGGQRWWDAILERIRSCDCFIFALSEASVTSKACRSELDYASQLGRWIVPVSVGPAVPDQLLPPVLAETQRVESNAPLSLARALLSLPPTPPLPDPLPDPPIVPVSYLDQLSEAVTREHLTTSEQRDLLGSIKQRLRDPEEKDAGLALLHRLRQHPEINAWVAEEIDAELAKVAASSDAAASTVTPPPPPPPPPPTQRTYYPPPQTFADPRPVAPPPLRKSRAGWWIAAILGLVLISGVGACTALVIIQQNNDDGGEEEQVDDGEEEPVDEFADLRDGCAGGDMFACDELFFATPEGSADEEFGSTCGGRSDVALEGECVANFGEFSP